MEKIDEDLNAVLAARNAVAHGLVVLMQDRDGDPNEIRPHQGPLVFAYKNKGEEFGAEDLAKLSPTATQLPHLLSEVFFATEAAE